MSEKGEVKGKENIFKYVCAFYKELFSKREVDRRKGEELLGGIKRALSEEHREGIEGEIKEEEIKAALTSMKGNKTPGGDGLPKEFYGCFWDIIKRDLVSVYREVYKTGKLIGSTGTGVIHLIHKKGEKKILEIGDQ